MGYKIEAFLENGKPALRIYDYLNENLCLSWNYQAGEVGIDKSQPSDAQLRQLFQQLILLTTKQDLNPKVRVFGVS